MTTTETRTPATPIETVTPIKPSEAMRLGCLLAPIQMFDEVYIDAVNPQRACAYGAMALGYFGDGDIGKASDEARRFHDQDRFDAPCPVAGCPMTSRADPAHLNDVHRWSRERIADWLEGLGL